MTPSGSLGPAVSTLRGRRACALMVPEASTPEAPGPRLLGRVHEPPLAQHDAGPTVDSPPDLQPPCESRTRGRAQPGRPDVCVVTLLTAFPGGCAKIRCEISQPIQARPRLPDRPQGGEGTGPDRHQMPCRAVRIGQPASQHLPEYADRPIPSPNCTYAEERWLSLHGRP